MRQRISIIIIGTFLLVGTFEAKGQTNYIYRHHQLHQVFINPATAGSEFFPVAALSYQKQWLGMNQSPSTILASTSLRIGNFDFYNPKMFINKSSLKTAERVGMGLGLYSDKNGPQITRGANLAYTYHLILNQSRLSFGLSGNIEQFILNGSGWDPIDPGDPLIENTRDSYYSFNSSFGVYYYSPTYFAGLSATHLIPQENKMNPAEQVKQDFILHTGYLFFNMETIKFEPSLNLRYLDYETFEFDIQAKVYLNHIHWIALSYRSYNAIAFSGGMKVKRFYLAYYHETYMSPVVKYSAGSHGVHIGMNLGIRRLEGF